MRRPRPSTYLITAALSGLMLVACSASPNAAGEAASTPVIVLTQVPTQTPPTAATQTEAAPLATSTISPLPSLTPTYSPTPAPSPTDYLTPPPPGQFAAIPILMYHHLTSLDPNASALQRTWTVSPTSFTEQLDYLLQRGYHTITFAQLDGFFEKGSALPARPVILTFDDGWVDDYEVAFPALREHGMVGTFFVPTAYADAKSKTLMGWSQIGEMDAAGMEFGGHTVNHANLNQVSNDEALRQLQASKSKMEEKLGHATLAFAYPFGGYNPNVIALVRQVGYRLAVGLCCGYKLRADILLTLPRIRISYEDSLEDFAKKLPPFQSFSSLGASLDASLTYGEFQMTRGER